MTLARDCADLDRAATELGTSGWVLASVPFAAFCFATAPDVVVPALGRCIGAGGDADTTAAMLGAWLGGLVGASALPSLLLDRIQDGPFGPGHLRGLAHAICTGGPAPRWFWPAAMLRNLALYPVVIGHGLRRLIPW